MNRQRPFGGRFTHATNKASHHWCHSEGGACEARLRLTNYKTGVKMWLHVA